MTGSKSHKTVTSDVSRILSLYYSPVRIYNARKYIKGLLLLQTILFVFCAGNELFFVALYLIKWNQPWATPLAYGAAPFCFIKNVVNMVQLWKSSKILVGVDLAERVIEREAAEARARRIGRD